MVQIVSVADLPNTVAPDGSLIDVLVAGEGGSMVRCTLPPGATTRAVQHRRVEELWFVARGSGWLWHGGEVVALRRNVSVRIEPSVPFQFQAGHGGLEIVIATMPPWPGADEAEPADGPWTATVAPT